jgi:hypothetical protein
MIDSMFRIWTWHAPAIATIWCCAFLPAIAQSELKQLQEIHLPVPASRGSYSGFPTLDMSSRQHFSMRVAPDQSLLILDSDTSGKWSLLRLREWWAYNPLIEVLSVPGWSAGDAKHLGRIHVDLQITPDGRYAIAFAGAVWMEKSDFLLFAPKGYVARKPDTVITAIDLERWKIINSVHTTDMADGVLHGVRITSDNLIALDFALGRSPTERLLYRYLTKLITVPELHSGPECVSDRPFRGGPSMSLDKEDAEPAKRQNGVACQDVLHATGTLSVEALEILIDRGQDVLPERVQQSSHDLQDTEDDYFRDWGSFPYYLFYYENPPFESSSHRWYGLYGSQERNFYNLVLFDPEGHKQKTQTVRSLLCGDSNLEQRGSACACRVIDVSEEQDDLLAYCRTQRGDYDGMVRREWLAALHSDDFSGAGFINLSPKYHHETLAQIARGNRRGYVVTLETGDMLRVYAIPNRPQEN